MHLVLLIPLGHAICISSMVTGISSVLDSDAGKFLAMEWNQSRNQAECRGWTL